MNVGKLGETSGIRFQGFYSRDSAQTAGLPARVHLRREPRLQPERRRLREALGLSGLGPGVQAVRAGPRLGHGVLPPASRRAVQRQPGRRSGRLRDQLQHQLRLHRGLPLDHAARRADVAEPARRGGRRGDPGRDQHLRRLHQVRRRPRADHPGAEPALGRGAVPRRRPDPGQGDAVGGRAVRLRAASRSRTSSTRRATRRRPTSASIRGSAPAWRSCPAARSSPRGARRSGRPRSSRTPARIPRRPCPLPFALGDDPPLEPVKASTLEGGFRYANAALVVLRLGVLHRREGRHLPHPVRRRGRARRGAPSTASS